MFAKPARAVFFATVFAVTAVATGASAQPAALPPTLEYAFTATIQLAPAVEMGQADGGRKRFIAVTGGSVSGPLFNGEILPGGGDWQVIEADGLARVDARYLLKAADGTVVEASTPGVRVADPAVAARIARGENVDPQAYYFRMTPRFGVAAGPHAWLRRSVFVARGVRRPDRVQIDYYVVR